MLCIEILQCGINLRAIFYCWSKSFSMTWVTEQAYKLSVNKSNGLASAGSIFFSHGKFAFLFVLCTIEETFWHATHCVSMQNQNVTLNASNQLALNNVSQLYSHHVCKSVVCMVQLLCLVMCLQAESWTWKYPGTSRCHCNKYAIGTWCWIKPSP